MRVPDETERAAWAIRVVLLCRRQLPLALWLAGTLLYGTIAGVLLHEHPYVAGAVLAAVWLSAIWRGARFA